MEIVVQRVSQNFVVFGDLQFFELEFLSLPTF